MCPLIWSLIASRLICRNPLTVIPIIDLFPEFYQSILDTLLSSSCAYVCPCISKWVTNWSFITDRVHSAFPGNVWFQDIFSGSDWIWGTFTSWAAQTFPLDYQSLLNAIILPLSQPSQLSTSKSMCLRSLLFISFKGPLEPHTCTWYYKPPPPPQQQHVAQVKWTERAYRAAWWICGPYSPGWRCTQAPGENCDHKEPFGPSLFVSRAWHGVLDSSAL